MNLILFFLIFTCNRIVHTIFSILFNFLLVFIKTILSGRMTFWSRNRQKSLADTFFTDRSTKNLGIKSFRKTRFVTAPEWCALSEARYWCDHNAVVKYVIYSYRDGCTHLRRTVVAERARRSIVWCRTRCTWTMRLGLTTTAHRTSVPSRNSTR